MTKMGKLQKKATLHSVSGFRTAATTVGLKKSKKPDSALLLCTVKRPVGAGVFTKNRTVAAPVVISRRNLLQSKGCIRAIYVNAGVANACTGKQGMLDAAQTVGWIAEELGCTRDQVMVCSTGVISELLPMDKMAKGVGVTLKAIAKKKNTGSFARAILTTDLVEKCAGISFQMAGKTVKIAGVCKGSGMIAPNMATMLAFLVSDISVSHKVLQKVLSEVNEETFNCITVDGDTSTNDSLIMLTSADAKNPTLSKTTGKDYESFRKALFAVCDSLAKQIAADGEGAKHTVTVYVGGTKTDAQAKKIARTISESPLVKTTIAGNDPNYGRIIAAAGRAGVPFDPNNVSLTLAGVDLWRAGTPLKFDARKASRALRKRDVGLVLLVGNGAGRARFYTCDLTHGYIEINADYHT